jgi:hypothetical protein
MNTPGEETIKEIAEIIEQSQRAYLHKETFEILELPPEEYLPDLEEAYAEDIAKLEAEPEAYIEFEPLPSREGFIIMEDFIELMDDGEVKDLLIDALNRKSPFYNFRYVLNGNPEVRTQFDDYKLSCIIEMVKRSITGHQLSNEE